MKKFLVIVFLCIFVLQVVSAIDTEIKIKTLPYHEVQVVAIDPSSSSFLIYERYIGYSDRYGDLLFNFSFTQPKFNLRIFLKKDNENVSTTTRLSKLSIA